MYNIQNMNCLNCVLIGLIVITPLSLRNMTLNRTIISEVCPPNKIPAQLYYVQKLSDCFNNNNKPNVIPQVGFGEGRVYANLTPTLGGRETVSDRPSTQGKLLTGSSSNSMNQSSVLNNILFSMPIRDTGIIAF
uniref:Putative ovule protein n=1 Tax=Solanum chacoense TaxID=4108 RepID=A0A0V0IAE7_SOLCH